MTNEEEFQRRLAEIEARERAVATRERVAEAKGIRHNLYDRINVSVRTLDIIIIACVAAIAVLVAVGIFFK